MKLSNVSVAITVILGIFFLGLIVLQFSQVIEGNDGSAQETLEKGKLAVLVENTDRCRFVRIKSINNDEGTAEITYLFHQKESELNPPVKLLTDLETVSYFNTLDGYNLQEEILFIRDNKDTKKFHVGILGNETVTNDNFEVFYFYPGEGEESVTKPLKDLKSVYDDEIQLSNLKTPKKFVNKEAHDPAYEFAYPHEDENIGYPKYFDLPNKFKSADSAGASGSGSASGSGGGGASGSSGGKPTGAKPVLENGQCEDGYNLVSGNEKVPCQDSPLPGIKNCTKTGTPYCVPQTEKGKLDTNITATGSTSSANIIYTL